MCVCVGMCRLYVRGEYACVRVRSLNITNRLMNLSCYVLVLNQPARKCDGFIRSKYVPSAIMMRLRTRRQLGKVLNVMLHVP